MEIAKPFIRLPFAFDAARLEEEALGLPAGAWMQHPLGLPGNSAVPVISRNGGDNDDFHGPMSVTRHLRTCPYMQQAMAAFGEVLGRSRLMKLEAGCEVSEHIDFNYHWYTRVRIHIPVVTNPEVTFYCADQSVNMRRGECWIFNSWRRHRVVNAGRQDRIHLVLDAAGSSRFWRMVRRMQHFDPLADRVGIDAIVQRVPFYEHKQVRLATENFNIAPVMAPGELDALVGELVRDFTSNPRNDRQLVDEYAALLNDFTKDWREIWHLFGYRQEGWPHYRAAINNVHRRLHPDPLALVTGSNDVGINQIVVQRILKSALAIEHLEHFLPPHADASPEARARTTM